MRTRYEWGSQLSSVRKPVHLTSRCRQSLLRNMNPRERPQNHKSQMNLYHAYACPLDKEEKSTIQEGLLREPHIDSTNAGNIAQNEKTQKPTIGASGWRGNIHKAHGSCRIAERHERDTSIATRIQEDPPCYDKLSVLASATVLEALRVSSPIFEC